MQYKIHCYAREYVNQTGGTLRMESNEIVAMCALIGVATQKYDIEDSPVYFDENRGFFLPRSNASLEDIHERYQFLLSRYEQQSQAIEQTPLLIRDRYNELSNTSASNEACPYDIQTMQEVISELPSCENAIPMLARYAYPLDLILEEYDSFSDSDHPLQMTLEFICDTDNDWPDMYRKKACFLPLTNEDFSQQNMRGMEIGR